MVLDELGRGTSTYDGVAIAAAVLNYVKAKCLCIFTTHYDLSPYVSDVRQYKMGYRIDRDHIEFTYKLEPGSTKSQAMNVARLAGIPEQVIAKALEMSKMIN